MLSVVSISNRNSTEGLRLYVPGPVLALLREHSEEASPEEACGLVLAKAGTAVGYMRGRNASVSSARFELALELNAVYEAEGAGLELVPFHSHPFGPAVPTEPDIRGAGLWQRRPYLIYGLEIGELRAWSIDGGRVSELRAVT